MPRETHVSCITVQSTEPVRIVRIQMENCVDIRINDLRVTVFYPEDDQMPEVMIQSEREAADFERAQRMAASVGIPSRKPAPKSHAARE